MKLLKAQHLNPSFLSQKFASLSHGTPPTCFEDIILVPIATWVFLLTLIAIYVPFYISSFYKRRTATYPIKLKTLQRYRRPATTNEREYGFMSAARWPKTVRFLNVLYLVLVICSLLMSKLSAFLRRSSSLLARARADPFSFSPRHSTDVLELVRLYLADREAGLLPFTLGGILLSLLLLHLPAAPSMRPLASGLLLLFWSLSLGLTATKLATIKRLEGPEPRIGTKYPASDQVIDLAVIVGLYGFFVICEGVRLPCAVREARRDGKNGEQGAWSAEELTQTKA